MSNPEDKEAYAEHWFVQGYSVAIQNVIEQVNAGTLVEFLEAHVKGVDDGTKTQGSQ